MPELPLNSERLEQVDRLTKGFEFWRRQYRRLHSKWLQLSNRLKEETQRREAVERELSALKHRNSYTTRQSETETGSDSTVPGHLTKLNWYDLTR